MALKVYVSRMDDGGNTTLQASREVWEAIANGRLLQDWRIVGIITQKLSESSDDVIQIALPRQDAAMVRQAAREG